jgi:hypothetical protein
MTDSVYTGGCLCGAVRYECGPPLSPPCLCHCESCRRASGAHLVAWATVRRVSFIVVSGALRQFVSSPPVVRQFCERCGASITYWNEESPDTIDVTVATLDAPESMAPADHIWMEDAASWDRPADGLPQFLQTRRAKGGG